MARRDRESEDSAHDLLFGSAQRPAPDRAAAEDGEDGRFGDGLAGDGAAEDERDAAPYRPSPRAGSRVEARRASRAKQRRRVVITSVIAIVVVLAAAIYFIAVPVYHYFSPEDYDGAGTGSVVVTVRANDGASQIGATLESAGVVASEQAFSDAADDNDKSQNIQAGSYRLRKHMSADSALTLLLDPSARVASDTVVAEGANVFRVEQLLALPKCGSANRSPSGCGLGASKATVVAALKNVRNLGIPTDYLPAKGKQPATVEGFLYPATYSFDNETTVAEALQQMVGKFTDVARSNRFSAAAAKVGMTPYQAVVAASMIQSEAKFATDMPKVARVIVNRLAAKTPLKIDAASVYAAELAGVDPKTTNFATIDSPYNTYRNTGLPPTPISNPGSDALESAVAPATGNWTYYVNGSADGHLYFTNSETDFVKAQKRCHDNGWGCAAP